MVFFASRGNRVGLSQGVPPPPQTCFFFFHLKTNFLPSLVCGVAMFRGCGKGMVGSRSMVMGEGWVAQCKEGTCEGTVHASGRGIGWLGSANGGKSCDVFVHRK